MNGIIGFFLVILGVILLLGMIKLRRRIAQGVRDGYNNERYK